MRIRLKHVSLPPIHGLVQGLELEAVESGDRNGFGRPYMEVVAPGTGVTCRIWPHEYLVLGEGGGDARQEDVSVD